MTEPGEISSNAPSRELTPSGKEALMRRGYVIKKEGAVKRIISRTTGQASSPFHEIKVETDLSGNIRALIGKLGATNKAVAFKEDLKTHQESIVESDSFHDFRYDPDLNLLLIRTGAMEYILDPETGKKVSKGYHSIKKKGGQLVGKIGTEEEVIEARSETTSTPALTAPKRRRKIQANE